MHCDMSLIIFLLVVCFMCIGNTRLLETCCNVRLQDIIGNRDKTITCLSNHNASEPPRYFLHRTVKTWQSIIIPTLSQHFPVDEEKKNYVRTVHDVVFSKTNPTPFYKLAKLVAVSDSVLTDLLNLDTKVTNIRVFKQLVSGSAVLSVFEPLTHRYGGHQFGYWSGQLGDGRAHLIAELVNHQGKHLELQLKGSGKTPYSRRGDGRAVVRSSVREFLCSEAMHYLGIPTSRAASISVSEDQVIRDQFYDGNPIKEPLAIVLRVAESWFRFGSFEILTDNGEIELLKTLSNFVISHHFPEISAADPNRYLAFYSSVVEQTAALMAKWQSVGFAHGVCNTDNFSILSITIDYGPFRFMDEYNPDMVPNTSDDEAMYSYKNQPNVGKFNLEKLRLALEPLFRESGKSASKQILAGYDSLFQEAYLKLFRSKLGLPDIHEGDEFLIDQLLSMMQETKSDFTMTFRQLGDWSLDKIAKNSIPKSLWALLKLQKHGKFEKWRKSYFHRVEQAFQSDAERQKSMHKVNPCYVLRNWIAQNVIKYTEKGDYNLLNKVKAILENPFEEQEEAKLLGLADPPPQWSEHIKVSCSS